MFNYRLGSGSRFNCRLYIGNGLKIITGYARQHVHPLHTKCWHKLILYKKGPWVLSPSLHPWGKPFLNHCPTLQTSTQGFHLAHPLLSVNAILQGLQQEPRRRRFLCKKSVNPFEENYKTLAQVLCFSTKRPYLAVCSVAQVLPFLWVFSHPDQKLHANTL